MYYLERWDWNTKYIQLGSLYSIISIIMKKWTQPYKNIFLQHTLNICLDKDS